MPAWPVGQPEHEVFALLTEHPEPDLHEVSVFHPLCHLFAGQAPHTICTWIVHAAVRRFPGAHVAHCLHAVPAECSMNVIGWPAEHTLQSDLPAVPWTQPVGQALHPV